ncbi:Permease of the drug/metabolite transporter (DMT) superfamily [Mariniphaga anaerophila]|uniref:Permease of the drug/metabolite transporter (DMT) superfamily n=1 Tax=Mariniphaga anaerophila TaxID=1484053 RepID=A0A1M4VGX6_9BACT|nr:DMT family transporter [Mariniphaga anaerophila]SHE68075.1 Permease of the drug/metabolite transporter (DMT) superfamily [Mariniphaga anaerophila]
MNNLLKNTTFLAIVATWLWSTAFVGVKIGLEYQTPLQFAGVRFFISGVSIFLILGQFKKFIREVKANLKLVVWVSLIQVSAQYALFYSGLNLVPGALGAMLVGSSPLFIAVVAHFSFQNDKMTLPKTFSILIGVIGIAIITLGRTKVEMRGEMELLGIGLLLINNLVAGYANVLVAKSPKEISPFVLSSSTLMIGGLVLGLISIPVEGINLGPFPPKYYVALAWLSFLSAAAISIWYILLRRPGVKVSVLNVWKFLIPVSGAILSWMILEDEEPDLISILGMLVIASSLILLNYTNRKSIKKPNLK